MVEGCLTEAAGSSQLLCQSCCESSQRAQQSEHNAAYSATFGSCLCDHIQVTRAGGTNLWSNTANYRQRHTSSAQMLPGQDRSDLSRIASKYPSSYLTPLSFFVSWQGVLTLAYKYVVR